MNCRFTLSVLAFGLISTIAQGYPTDKPVPNVFSSDTIRAFKLYSSTEADEIYYIPKRGGIALFGDLEDPLPAFSANWMVSQEFPFYNKRLMILGGDYSTLGLAGLFKKLIREAREHGYRMSPFPVAKASSSYLLKGGKPLSQGFKLDCTVIPVPMPVFDDDGNPVLDKNGKQKTVETNVPRCLMPHPEDPTKKVATSTLIEYEEFDVDTTDINTDIGFAATIHPAQSKYILQLLKSGAPWDAYMKTRVKWEGSVLQTPFYAELHVNWKSLIDALWIKAAIHNNACVDVEVDAMMADIVTCNDKEKCGVSVVWYNSDGTKTANDGRQPPPSMKDFQSRVEMVRSKLQDELFDYIDLPPEPGNPKDSGAIFSVRANYRKLSVERNEIIPVYYFPDPKLEIATTTMSPSCMKGRPGEIFSFNTKNPKCLNVLKDSNIGKSTDGL